MPKLILLLLIAIFSLDASAQVRSTTDAYGNSLCRDVYGNIVRQPNSVDLSRVGLDGIKAGQDTLDAIERRKLSALIRQEREIDIQRKSMELESIRQGNQVDLQLKSIEVDSTVVGPPATVYRDTNGNAITCSRNDDGSLSCK